MHGELPHGNVIGGILGMCPSKDGIRGRVEDVLGIGAGEIGGEVDVKRVVNHGIGRLGIRDWWRTLGNDLGLVHYLRHAH